MIVFSFPNVDAITQSDIGWNSQIVWHSSDKKWFVMANYQSQISVLPEYCLLAFRIVFHQIWLFLTVTLMFISEWNCSYNYMSNYMTVRIKSIIIDFIRTVWRWFFLCFNGFFSSLIFRICISCTINNPIADWSGAPRSLTCQLSWSKIKISLTPRGVEYTMAD